MNLPAILREPVKSISLPHNFPANAIMGKHGKIVNIIRERSGAVITYINEEHRLDISGRPRVVAAAAELVHKTVEHYQYTGHQFSRKEIVNILSPELASAESIQLVPRSSPVNIITGSYEGFVLSARNPTSSSPEDPSLPKGPSSSPSSSPSSAPSSSSSSSSSRGGRAGFSTALFRPHSDLDAALDQLLDLALLISLEHPAECDSVDVKLYLGKLLLCDLTTSARAVSPEELLRWNFPSNGRAVFDTSLPQETIRSLDSHLTARGMVATQQTKSASLHLETSIPWVQYHPTFAVGPDGALSLSKLETTGCKPLTVALVGQGNCLDVRLRFVAACQHRPDDAVGAELRSRQDKFSLLNGVQVVVPADLKALDLTLTSARVKLKRVYSSNGPLPPPPHCASSASASTAKQTRTRQRKQQPQEQQDGPGGELAPVSLKVSVAAVVDNLGGRKLEVTASCPELNAALAQVHRSRKEGPGVRQRLADQMRSLLAHVEDLRRNVAFQP